jgi:uncharacterized coiled-coil protein SlyX
MQSALRQSTDYADYLDKKLQLRLAAVEARIASLEQSVTELAVRVVQVVTEKGQETRS